MASSPVSRTTAVIVGRNRGRMIMRKGCQDEAFSTVAASIASLGMLRRAAPITSIEKPVIDQILASVTTSRGSLSRKLVLGMPSKVENRSEEHTSELQSLR